jgi:hypothetical protein
MHVRHAGRRTLPRAARPYAIEVGQSDFTFVSDLAAQGFTPFATSASGNASFGMTDGTDLYLCFIADNLEAQAERQQA